MHILKRNKPYYLSSLMKDTFLYHPAKPPLLSTCKKSSSFTSSSHHTRYINTSRRIMFGRGGAGGGKRGPASGSSSSRPQTQDASWAEQQRKILTHAMFTSLLEYINAQRSPAHHLTMEQLLSKLWRLPPAHRGTYTKLLMVSLIKKKVSDRRRIAEAAVEASTGAPTEPQKPRYSSPSTTGTPALSIPCLQPTHGTDVPPPCEVAQPSNRASLEAKKTHHVPDFATPLTFPSLPFSEHIYSSQPMEQVPSSRRDRLSSGCDDDTSTSNNSMGFSSSDRSSSGDDSFFSSRLKAGHLEAPRFPSLSSNGSQFLLLGKGQKRGASPEPGSDRPRSTRMQTVVRSPKPSSNQSTRSTSDQERSSPQPAFNFLNKSLRESQPRQGFHSESSSSESIPRSTYLTSPLPLSLRTPTPAHDMSFLVAIPARQSSSPMPRLSSSSPVPCLNSSSPVPCLNSSSPVPCLNSSSPVPQLSSSPTPQLSSNKRHRRSWGNPLKRIFVQAPDTNGAAVGPASSAADQTTPHLAATPASENGGSANSRVASQSEANSSSGNRSSATTAADSTSGGSSSVGSVSTSSNPFARVATPSSSWTAGSSSSNSSSSAATADTHHHRPVLAPSKLGGFGSSLSQQQGAPIRPLGGGILAPSSLFGGATSKGLQSAEGQQSQAKFKLKPSILGSAVTSNPFSKTPTVDFEPDSKDNEAESKKESGTDASPPVRAKSTTASSDAVDSSEAKAAEVSSETSAKRSSDSPDGSSASPKASSSFTTATPPPSPPTSMRRQDVMGASSSSMSAASSVAPRPSVFGVFGQAVAAQEKTPAACSSPKPPAMSTNGVNSPLPSGSLAAAAAPSFIFGQNLQSRVVGSASDDGEDSEAAAAAAAPTPALDASEDNFFTAAASTLATSSASGSTRTQNGGPAKSLETSSRELAEKESREKRKFEEVQVITGEETESNVLQMNCKVYRWVKGSWQERGRGILRLNDWGSGGTELHSRLVVRTQGTLTIMLNTNIWSEMAVERASNKSVRFTASDPDGTPNIYLVMGLPKDIDLLYTSLEWRVSNARRREQNESNKRAKPDDKPSSSTSLN